MIARIAAQPIKAYRSGLRTRWFVVFSLLFWPCIALATLLVSSAVSAIAILGQAVLLVLPVLFLLGRPATLVVAEGIRVVPRFGSARTYVWPDIEYISEDLRGHGKPGNAVYWVRLHANDRRKPIPLPSVGNHRRAVAELSAYVAQHSAPSSVDAHDPPTPASHESPTPARRGLQLMLVAVLVGGGSVLLLVGSYYVVLTVWGASGHTGSTQNPSALAMAGALLAYVCLGLAGALLARAQATLRRSSPAPDQ